MLYEPESSALTIVRKLDDEEAKNKNLRRWLTVCVVGWSITLIAGLALLWSIGTVTAPPDFGSAYSEEYHRGD